MHALTRMRQNQVCRADGSRRLSCRSQARHTAVCTASSASLPIFQVAVSQPVKPGLLSGKIVGEQRLALFATCNGPFCGVLMNRRMGKRKSLRSFSKYVDGVVNGMSQV